jgi:hypothetical protein
MESGAAVLKALQALNAGDFSVNLDDKHFSTKTDKDIAREINDLATRQRYIAAEFKRVEAATQCGDLSTRVNTTDSITGGWATYTQTLNTCLDNTTKPLQDMVAAIDSVRLGNLEYSPISVATLQGEYLKAHESVQDLTVMLRHFADEVTDMITDLSLGQLGTTVCL